MASCFTHAITVESTAAVTLRGSTTTTVGKLVDSRDDQVYRTVVLGGLEWTAENMRYTLTGSRCYAGEEKNCITYGRLYSYDQSDSVCPPGWRLPSDGDWLTLEKSLGMPQADLELLKYTAIRGRGIGDKLKDPERFHALPAGYWNKKRKYMARGDRTYWWTSTELKDGYVVRRRVNWIADRKKYPDTSTIGRFQNPTGSFHISVRCLRETTAASGEN